MIRGKPTADDIPFDILTDRYAAYPIDDPGTEWPSSPTS
jgi:hypothetical protein